MWATHTIHGTSVDLFDAAVGKATGGLLFLHDRDGATLRRLPDADALLTANRLSAASPQCGECWWTDRIWPSFAKDKSVERWLIGDLLPDLRTRWGNAPVAVAGIGMGGQGALRIAFKHPDLFPIVAALDAAVDCHDLYYEGTSLDDLYPSREHCRQDSPVLHISPVKQPRHILFACEPASRWERGNDRLHEKLTALGVAHRYSTEAAEITLRKLIEYVANALREESRRLL
jgi:pimeloyl-ACP methyl ester carboxylesterase